MYRTDQNQILVIREDPRYILLIIKRSMEILEKNIMKKKRLSFPPNNERLKNKKYIYQI